MKLIAHRGLVDGPNPELENHPRNIVDVINSGVDVEVDVWLTQDAWYVGHDCATYKVDFNFLSLPQMWIHAKNFEAADQLIQLSRAGHKHNFFWHDQDHRTLTSWGFWWTYPNCELGVNSVSVMPEWHVSEHDFKSLMSLNCHGICTDWVNRLR